MKSNKPLQPTLDLCHYASDLLRAAGFKFHGCSRTTEACYYRWPDRTELLRVAAHKADPKHRGLSGEVVSRLTFNGNHHTKPEFLKISDEKVDQMIAQAIGWYFLRSKKSPASPKPAGR